MAQWSGKTIGPLLGYKIFLYTIKWLGIGTAYSILHVVTTYYFWFARTGRKNLTQFYQRALGVSKKEATRLAKKNFQVFGQTLIDRAAFQMGQADKYTYSFNGEAHLLNLKDQETGSVLMSAHLGNWETAGNLLKKRISNKINAIMLDAEVEKIKQFMTKNTGGSHFNIIPIKDDLSHIIRIKNALSDKEFVAVHADRYISGTKHIEVNFFNQAVKFPYGPFLIAAKFKTPITFVYAVKTGKRHYSLSATEPIIVASTPEEIALAYVNKLEQMVKEYPEQWFNYYNYFEQ